MEISYSSCKRDAVNFSELKCLRSTLIKSIKHTQSRIGKLKLSKGLSGRRNCCGKVCVFRPPMLENFSVGGSSDSDSGQEDRNLLTKRAKSSSEPKRRVGSGLQRKKLS